MLKACLLPVLLVSTPLLDSIDSLPAWQGVVEMSVESPALDAENTVNYEVRSLSEPADTIVGAEYVVTWPGDHIEAYAQGSLYLRAGKGLMTELHPDSLTLARRHGRPVAADLTCVEIVPQAMARSLRRQIADGDFRVEASSDSVLTLSSLSTSRRIDLRRDASGMLIMTVTTGGNYPTLTTYRWNGNDDASLSPITGESLLTDYSHLFTRYNPRYITPESLVGTPMPVFRLRTLEGDRYEWHEGMYHPAPVIIALLDSPDGVGYARRVAREAGNCELIFAFTANNPEEVSEWISAPRPGERVLLRAAEIMRSTGIRNLPALIKVDTEGIVENIDFPSEEE